METIHAEIKEVDGGFQVAVWTGDKFTLATGWVEVVDSLEDVPSHVRDAVDTIINFGEGSDE